MALGDEANGGLAHTANVGCGPFASFDVKGGRRTFHVSVEIRKPTELTKEITIQKQRMFNRNTIRRYELRGSAQNV
jgi:hypothetical protein